MIVIVLDRLSEWILFVVGMFYICGLCSSRFGGRFIDFLLNISVFLGWKLVSR